MSFKAFSAAPHERELVAVDLGYSAQRRSCGLHWTGVQEPVEVSFDEAIARTGKRVLQLTDPVLVLEAVLSTYHAPSGNPDIRGDFERGRGWYYDAGVLSFAAALRFLQELKQHVQGRDLDVAEAFLSNKDTPTGHGEDARLIHDRFWTARPETLRGGVEPASPLVRDVPSVRVFTPA